MKGKKPTNQDIDLLYAVWWFFARREATLTTAEDYTLSNIIFPAVIREFPSWVDWNLDISILMSYTCKERAGP